MTKAQIVKVFDQEFLRTMDELGREIEKVEMKRELSQRKKSFANQIEEEVVQSCYWSIAIFMWDCRNSIFGDGKNLPGYEEAISHLSRLSQGISRLCVVRELEVALRGVSWTVGVMRVEFAFWLLEESPSNLVEASLRWLQRDLSVKDREFLPSFYPPTSVNQKKLEKILARAFRLLALMGFFSFYSIEMIG